MSESGGVSKMEYEILELKMQLYVFGSWCLNVSVFHVQYVHCVSIVVFLVFFVQVPSFLVFFLYFCLKFLQNCIMYRGSFDYLILG